jgi:hypothetical protein
MTTGAGEMSKEVRIEGKSVELVERTIDPQTIIDGAVAYGAAAGGTGTLLLGIAKVKDAFGSGEAADPPPPTSTTEE